MHRKPKGRFEDMAILLVEVRKQQQEGAERVSGPLSLTYTFPLCDCGN